MKLFQVLKSAVLVACLLSVSNASPAVAALPSGMEMVKIPAGSFVMGAPCKTITRECPEDDPFTSTDESAGCVPKEEVCEGEAGERPAHTVRITRSFLLAKTEVTQKQWHELMGNNPSEFQSDSLGYSSESNPVEQVNWWDAVAYTNALSTREGLPACYQLKGCSGRPGDGRYKCSSVKVTARGGNPTRCKGYRLPTEAEWEYAARAGTTGPRYGELSRVAWYRANSGLTTNRVGKKQANAWGLYDMLGNVSEWTWDWKRKYSSGSSTDPVGANSGSFRVYRGCSWFVTARVCRAAYRGGIGPEFRFHGRGFRPARSMP